MKKLLPLVLALFLSFSLASCTALPVVDIPSPVPSVVPSIEPVQSTPTPVATLMPLSSPLKLPRTALLADHVKKSRHIPFNVITEKSDTQNYYVKLFDAATGTVAYEFFVRGGSTLKGKVAPGTFLLRYATGKDWYGNDLCFGPGTVYTKSDDRMEFYKKGGAYHGMEITLYTVPNGGLYTQPASPDEFR